VDWGSFVEERQARYAGSHGDLDERALVRKGNVAYAAALGLTMLGDPAAPEWFRRAAGRWRESWRGGESWGRPIGALKASLLAGDEAAVDEVARWTLELRTVTAASAIGRYAAVLALLALRRADEAGHVAATLRGRDDFPDDVAGALAAIAAGDAEAYASAVRSVVTSFEVREAFLEDARVADTALVLDLLARRLDLAVDLPVSEVLPPGLHRPAPG
jgi:hypothetical protein